jgi:hypothetical protein
MVRARTPSPWLRRAAYKYALIRRDPQCPELLCLWEALHEASKVLDARRDSEARRAWEECRASADEAARAMAQKYPVAVVPAALAESERTALRDGEPGEVTALLNHEWPMAVTLNEGHYLPALVEAVRPPGEHGSYLFYFRGGDSRLPHEHKREITTLHIDIDLARVTTRDIQDLADQFRVLLRRCYPYALRLSRSVRRPPPSVSVTLDGPVGVALPTYNPAPQPRAVSVQVLMSAITTWHFAKLVREFKAILRRYIPRGGTRSGDRLAWLHTALPRDVAKHLQRFDLHFNHHLNFRLIAFLEKTHGRKIDPIPKKIPRLGAIVAREKSVAESVKLIYLSIYGHPYRATGTRRSTEHVVRDRNYSCPIPGHDAGGGCDERCPTWLRFAQELNLPSPRHGTGPERPYGLGRLADR